MDSFRSQNKDLKELFERLPEPYRDDISPGDNIVYDMFLLKKGRHRDSSPFEFSFDRNTKFGTSVVIDVILFEGTSDIKIAVFIHPELGIVNTWKSHIRKI